MCERPEALQALGALEADGVREVNSPAAVLGTYRERMIAQFAEAGVAFVPSRLVATSGERVDVPGPSGSSAPTSTTPRWAMWSTPRGRQGGRPRLAGMAARGMSRAVVQPHVDGDLIKFYGIGPGDAARRAAVVPVVLSQGPDAPGVRLRPAGPRPPRAPGRGRSRPRDLRRRLHRHRRGEIVLIDLNAWPSFALFREEAASAIAAYLSVRFGRGA